MPNPAFRTLFKFLIVSQKLMFKVFFFSKIGFRGFSNELRYTKLVIKSNNMALIIIIILIVIAMQNLNLLLKVKINQIVIIAPNRKKCAPPL